MGFNCETGGYSLSCNVLYSGAYKAMAAMGALMNEPADTIGAWNDLGAKIAEGINRQHWRADAGYYTPGPIGSDGYEESFWENLGQSLAVWPRFGIADKTRRLSVLDNKDIAFNEWGFAEREYNDRYFTREDICFTMGHDAKWATHGRSVWLFTEVGEVVAMGAEGRMSELEQVFFAGLRDGAFNKTFHECVHWDTGLAWRYGGQLWNAVAYVAMIVQGMLGMEYDESGITFAHRCIPEAFADMRITNLKYRGAVLTIQVNGWGTEGSVLLDGAPATTIPADLAGEHTVTLDMGEAPATGSHVPAQTSPDPRPAGLRVHAAVGDVVVRNAGGTTLTCRLVDVTGRVVAARQLREGQLLRVPERRVGSGTMLLVSESEDGVHISRLFVGRAPGN